MTRNEEIAINELAERGEILPELDQHIETMSDEYRFGFSFPWRLIDDGLKNAIIDYEHLIRDDPWYRDYPDMIWYELKEQLYNSKSTIGLIIFKEIAERYGL